MSLNACLLQRSKVKHISSNKFFAKFTTDFVCLQFGCPTWDAPALIFGVIKNIYFFLTLHIKTVLSKTYETQHEEDSFKNIVTA